MSEIDAVEPTVKDWIETWIKRVDTNEDGRISYYEFLYIVIQLKELKLDVVTDQDLEDTKTNVQRGMDVEKLPLSYVGAANWLAKIYILKQKQKRQKSVTIEEVTLEMPGITIELTMPEEKAEEKDEEEEEETGSFEDPWSEERTERRNSKVDSLPDLNPLAHLRKDTYSEREWDIESQVNTWDLDKLVDEVFSEEGSDFNDLFSTNSDTTAPVEDFTEEHFEEFAKQRRRKRDIVLGVIKTIIRNDAKHARSQSSPVAGFDDTQSSPSDGSSTPTTPLDSSQSMISIFTTTGLPPGSRRRMIKEKVKQKLRAGSWSQIKVNPVV